jgi:hypothetical protein
MPRTHKQPSLRSYNDDSNTDADTSRIQPSHSNTNWTKTKNSKRSEIYKSSETRSNNNLTGIKSIVMLENTYRLKPNEDERIINYIIEPKIHELLRKKLSEYDVFKTGIYESNSYSNITQELADTFRKEVKCLVMQRYKIVAHVLIGQDINQDVRVASRCLWNSEVDCSVAVSYRGKGIFIVLCLYFFYRE